MDLQTLAAFLQVAESQSFSKAADKLHRSQPAVSKRIAVLETQLRKPLFDRIGRRIALTDAGRALLPHARRVLQEIEDAQRALSHLMEPVSGRLSIGTSHHIGLHRLPSVLKAFALEYPKVDLDIHFMDSEVACQAVLAGTLELGIVTLPPQPLPHLQTRRLWSDPMVVVVSPDHVLAQRKNVQPAELAKHPAVLPDASTYTHRIIKAKLQKHRLQPQVRLATNYLETLKMLVAIGLGWSVLPRSMLDRSVHPLEIPALQMQRELGAVWHQRRTLSSAASVLLRRFEDHPGKNRRATRKPGS
ncbi:MAG: LysR family transcriptional regulator [Nevskiales bacterium]|nr:LysR family transcriptional regulator [Nevskiales bacterium]